MHSAQDSVVSGEPNVEATIDQINGQQEGKIDSAPDQRQSYQGKLCNPPNDFCGRVVPWQASAILAL